MSVYFADYEFYNKEGFAIKWGNSTITTDEENVAKIIDELIKEAGKKAGISHKAIRIKYFNKIKD